MAGLWIAVSGQQVEVGTVVQLDYHPDEVGTIIGIHHERGLPNVNVTEGPNAGLVRQAVFPARIVRIQPQ